MTARQSVKIVPWDDPAFVHAYERAAADLQAEGIELHRAAAPVELQRRLRAAGFPNAVCHCERTPDTILAGVAHCVVDRDGTTVSALTTH